MPRPRPRPDPCDCFDCLDEPQPSTSADDPLPPHLASARQQPPPKCVLVVADGVLTGGAPRGVPADVATPHADAVARRGCVGVLSLREGGGSLLEQVVLGCGQPTPSLPARFHDISAALVTTDGAAADALAGACLDAVRVVGSGEEIAAATVDAVTAPGDDAPDMVIVHAPDLAAVDAALQAVARLPAAHAAILTVVVLGGPAVRLPPPGGGPTPVPGVPRPRQSYELDGNGHPVALAPHAALIAVRCVGITRVDGVAAIDAAAAAARGALGAAPAEAVLADVAFKLGRASKYGA